MRITLFPVLPLFLSLFLQYGDCAACRTDRNCAYNGRCTEDRCICTGPWEGEHCERLQTSLRASLTGGFGSPHFTSQDGYSTWGGSVLVDNDGIWHMFASQMKNKCGIDYWEPNSRIVHASSSKGFEGPYQFESIIIDAFAHEPNAVRSPQGDWVLYFTMRHPPGWEVNCTDKSDADDSMTSGPLGATVRSGERSALTRHRKAQSQQQDGPVPPRHTYMVHSPSPYGPWSEPVIVLKANYSHWGGKKVLVDTNLAVVILPSGQVVGMWRKCVNVPDTSCEGECCTFPRLLEASNWSEPSTYRAHGKVPIFPELTPFGAEDPMLWLDKDDENVIHAILHDEQGPRRCTSNGRHAFSDDGGKHWVYAKENAYNGSVKWRQGGATEELYRRERPHIILDRGNNIVALSNGIQESSQSDRSWTMIQPLQ